MNFMIWNVRGLNHPSKQKEVKSMIKVHNIGFDLWDYAYNYDQHFFRENLDLLEEIYV
jgi:hypothetical protein